MSAGRCVDQLFMRIAPDSNRSFMRSTPDSVDPSGVRGKNHAEIGSRHAGLTGWVDLRNTRFALPVEPHRSSRGHARSASLPSLQCAIVLPSFVDRPKRLPGLGLDQSVHRSADGGLLSRHRGGIVMTNRFFSAAHSHAAAGKTISAPIALGSKSARASLHGLFRRVASSTIWLRRGSLRKSSGRPESVPRSSLEVRVGIGFTGTRSAAPAKPDRDCDCVPLEWW